MSERNSGRQLPRTPARATAWVILFISLLGVLFSLTQTTIGNWPGVAAICGGTIAVNLLILVVGGLIVGRYNAATGREPFQDE